MGSVTKTVTVLVGLPFSGKTTWVNTHRSAETLVIERDAFLERLQADPERRTQMQLAAESIAEPVSRLSSDVRKNAYNDVLTAVYVNEVTSTIRSSDAESVMVDGTHLQALSRSFVRNFPEAKKVAVVFIPNPELSIQRLLQAELSGVRRTVTPDLIRRMAEVFEMPADNEGFDEVYVL